MSYSSPHTSSANRGQRRTVRRKVRVADVEDAETVETRRQIGHLDSVAYDSRLPGFPPGVGGQRTADGDGDWAHHGRLA